MNPISRLVRATVIVACAAATAVGVILIAAPRWTSETVGATPEPLHITTAFAVALLLAVAAFLLRSHRGPSVRYQAVRFEDAADIRRPTPAKLRPKVGAKVRMRVRDAAAARVAAASRRRRD